MTKLIDSDTNETVTAAELGITDEEYAALIEESRAPEAGDTGHVRTSTGRRVYAA